MEKMLLQVKEQISAHQDGSQQMTPSELAKQENLREVYQKKLDQLSAPISDDDVERILERERMAKERAARRKNMIEEELLRDEL